MLTFITLIIIYDNICIIKRFERFCGRTEMNLRYMYNCYEEINV